MNPSFAVGSTKICTFVLSLSVALFGCSSGGGNEAPGDDKDNGEIPKFSSFEGRSILLTSDLNFGEVVWSQLSGPAVLIEDGSLPSITVSVPWIDNGPQTAEFRVSGSIDGEAVSRQVNLEILDRRYIVMRVENADDTATDLFINYISANDDEGVPEQGTERLTAVETGVEVCNAKVSPNGQYVAYSLKFDAGFFTSCYGIYTVDIESLASRKVSQLAQDSSDIEVGNIVWSPDSQKIAYRGDHGSGIEQNYVIDLFAPATSYINYGNNSLEFGQWPNEDLFPVENSGNPYGLDMIESTEFSQLQWLGNSNGLSLIVTDSVSSDRYPFQASVHGDARKLERFNQGVQEAFEIIPPEVFECPTGSTCVTAGPFASSLEKINREYVNPRLIETSIEGRMLIIASMLATNETSPIDVLGVREPVIDNANILTATPIEGINVYDAAWSPVAEDLAFSAELEYRHSHQSIEDVPSVYDLFGPETPGQLYLFQDYEQGHSGESHERLSNPVDSIDENSVIALEWSPQGTHIAYARGENGDEVDGSLLTSLWVTVVDDERDQSAATIDANTELLLKIDESDGVYIRDFRWSPSGEGLLLVIKRYFGSPDTTLRYLSRDGTYDFEFQTLTDINQATLASIHAHFSPDGRYVAYFDEESESKEAIFIQPIDGGDRVRANLDIAEGGNFREQIQWSPHGDAIIYAADSDDDGSLEHYLANVAGENQNLDLFIDVGSRIVSIVTDQDTGNLGLPVF